MSLMDQYNAGVPRRQTLVVQQPRYRPQAPQPRTIGRSMTPAPPIGNDPLSRVAAKMAPKAPEQQEEQGDSSWGRGLGVLVNNPLTRNILKPLQLLDLPRRAAILGVEQMATLLPQEAEYIAAATSLGMLSPMLLVDEDKVAEDERSNWEKFKDPEYGFGQITGDTGNKWLDRTIGLAGDIALDPLTYVAGIGFAGKGASSVGGRAARAAAVNRAVDAGYQGADVARVLQRGFGHASPELLEKAGVHGGIRVGLPFTKGKMIPHTEGLVRPLSKARGGAAARFNQTNLGQKALNLRAPKGMEDAYRAAFAGEGDVPTALERMALEDERLLGMGSFQGDAERLTKRELKELRKMNRSQKSRILNEVETQGTDPNIMDRALDKVWNLAEKFGINTQRRLNNYSPHITTRDARKWLAAEGEDANDFGRLTGITTLKLFEPSGVTMARRLRRGQKVLIKGEELEIVDDSVEALNKLFREKYNIAFDVYETDPAIILEKYINMLASDVGWSAGFMNRVQKSNGAVIDALTDDEMRLLGMGERQIGPNPPISMGGRLPAPVKDGQLQRPQFTLSGGGTLTDDDLAAVAEIINAQNVRGSMVTPVLEEEATEALNKTLGTTAKEAIDSSRLARTKGAGEALNSLENVRLGLNVSIGEHIDTARLAQRDATKLANQLMDQIDQLSMDARVAAEAASQYTWLREYIDYWTKSMDDILPDLTDNVQRRQIRQLRKEFGELRDKVHKYDEEFRRRMSVTKRSAEDVASQAYTPTREMREAVDNARTTATEKVDLAGKERRLAEAQTRLRDYQGTQAVDPATKQARISAVRAQRDAKLKTAERRLEAANLKVRQLVDASDGTPQAREEILAAHRELRDALEQLPKEREAIERKASQEISAIRNETTNRNAKASKSHVTRLENEVKRLQKEVDDARNTIDTFSGYIEDRFYRGTEWREGRVPVPAELKQLAERYIKEWERAGGFSVGEMALTELAQRMRAGVPADTQAIYRAGRGALDRIKVVQEELLGNITDPAMRERLRQRAADTAERMQAGGRQEMEGLGRLLDRNVGVPPVGRQMPAEQKYLDDLAKANEDIAATERKLMDVIGDNKVAEAEVEYSKQLLWRANRTVDEAGKPWVAPPHVGESVAGKGGQKLRTFAVEQDTRLNELQAVVDAADFLPPDVRAATQALLNSAVDSLDKMGDAAVTEARMLAVRKRASKNDLARMLTVTLDDHWTAMKPLLADTIGAENIVIRKELEQQLHQLWDKANHKDFWPVIDTFTNLFKTYATLSPGFHVRNAMSAVFMNSSDNVPIKTQMKAARLMHRMARAAKRGKYDEFLGTLTPLERQSIEGAMGTGMGGFFRERGVGDRATARYAISERIFENPLTDMSKRAGSFVEGAVRLPVVMDTLENGGTVLEGMQRARRLHFDYSQVSQFDERMKRLIPFWTFMSRNLPLQISQMWTHPRTYAKYNSFIRNFRGEKEPGEPDYFGSTGAFRFMDVELGGLPMYLQPDFAHTRLEEDAQNAYDFLSFENMVRPLTNFNPLYTAPLEFATGKDFFTGRQYDETDLRQTGPLEAPIAALLAMLGQSEVAPNGKRVYSEKALDTARSLIPLYDRAVRLAPGPTTGAASEDAMNRRIESYLRFIGIPVRQLSPQQQRAQLRSDRFSALDDRDMQRAIMQAAS